jgi:hypothetical protein
MSQQLIAAERDTSEMIEFADAVNNDLRPAFLFRNSATRTASIERLAIPAGGPIN